MLRVVEEVRPRFVFAENVVAAPILRAASELRLAGFHADCGRVSAASVGAVHRRIRFWLVAHADRDGEHGLPVNAEMAESPRLPLAVWANHPGTVGVDDGLSGRMDRLAALGNAQLPSVAALAWRVLGGEVG
jgi:DNA (cytosine-5)-methyltransferase 1